ncbi:unnamed protein product, partial [Adineta steineri]
MTSTDEEIKLQRCFEAIIEIVQKVINKIKAQEQNGSSDTPLTNSALDVNIHSFTLDIKEETLMEELKTDLEYILIDSLPTLSKYCRRYLLDFLYQFNYKYEEKQFTTSFNIDSIKAFQASWDGQLEQVKKFIEKYPAVKDKSGLWGTTLLYSAARNNHMKVVQYLIKIARCSVNAQNQQHIMRALAASTIHDDDYEVIPTAGSTALHGACFYGHLEMVKFLINHRADYFIKNHAEETPIMNANGRSDIIEFFCEFLILGYSLTTSILPLQPILENSSQIVDCIWEYKPFTDERWFDFSNDESSELQKSLLIKPNEEFKREVHLKVRKGVYTVSLMKFLRSGKDQDYTQNLAWVRCRGSSILNFDCYALWQIMLIKHRDAVLDSTLEMLTIPTIYNSTFKIQLKSWYYCDARTNTQLDRAINYRRKHIALELPFIAKKKLTFDLQTFKFSSEENDISGYIRWIPKMISNNSRHKGKIISIDQYKTLTNMDPIPLTTSRLNQLITANEYTPLEDEDEFGENNNNNNDDDDDLLFENISQNNNDDIAAASEKTPETPISTSRSLNDIFTNRASNTNQSEQDFIFNSIPNSNLTTDQGSEDITEKNIDDCINETAANLSSSEQLPLVEKMNSNNNNEIEIKLMELQRENEKLVSNLEDERIKIQSMFDSNYQESAKHEQQLAEMMQRIDLLEKEQDDNKKQQLKLQQIINSIKCIEYNNIEKEVILDIFMPKHKLIIKYLRDTIPNIDPSFTDRIPNIIFQEDHQVIVTVIGFQEHHNEFKVILKRIWSLRNIIQSAKDYYQRYLNRTIRSLVKETLSQVKSRARIWHEYKQLFIQLFKEKTIEYKKKFDDYIYEKLKLLINKCITNELVQPWIQIRTDTNNFLKDDLLMNNIDLIKQKAFDEFIKQNISMQRLKLDKEPTIKSANVVQNFIEKVQKEFQTNKIYQGHQIEHFNLIPKLLERLMLYHSCFKLQLPLYESSEDLLNKIDKHAVTTISTSTGSGKSTLLPALLIAEGYDKVIVTQPRRLPCQLICKRVNQTMTIDVGSSADKLAGWAVSGADKNPQAKVLYLTDGLLKERLLYDNNFITTHTQLNKSVVFFIDEVHERSVNIDLCLALLARLLTDKPELKSKMKVIISSATLDSSVPNLFRQIPQAGLAEFKMPQMGTLYPVTVIPRPNENILDIVQELCKKRKRHDQILCFVSSVMEVNQCCRLINEISRGTIVAYPLVQSQHPNVQQENIEHGTVFFSTTVAETSLTFPSLKYVVDTGMINTPIYNIESKRTILKEVRAAQSTIKQRLGRLGRTQSGEYYSLYSFKVDDLLYPIPQICQSDLMNNEFSLRKSPLQKGLDYMKIFLPDKPSQQSINATIQQLKRLGIIEATSNDQLTQHGKTLAKLPDFGSLAMSKSVLAALEDYQCGRDLICLSSILGVLNTTTIFKSIPQTLKSPDGDFMTLLNIMNEILLVKQSVSTNQFDLERICQAKGLTGIQHVIRQALRRYTTLENLFNLSPDFRKNAQVISGNWEFIARSLLEGYSDNVFVSKEELQDRHLHYERYNGQGDIAVLDIQSTLTRPINTAPVSLILARDIRHSTAIRATAILSFVGEIKSEWIEYKLERKVAVTNEEEQYLNSGNKYSTALSKFSNKINMLLGGGTIVLKGPSGTVLNAELHLRQEMISELKFTLQELGNTNAHKNFTHNL